MRKATLLHILIISFVFLLAATASYAGAIENSKERVRNNPDDVEAHYWLGFNYFMVGKYKEAIESYKQAIRINPDYVDAHRSIGLAYALLGSNATQFKYKSLLFKEAIESYKHAIRIDPDPKDAVSIGSCYGELGMYQEGIESYKQAIRIDPDYALAYYGLGHAYLGLNDRGSAMEQYKILKKLDTELANELFNKIYK